ncbi:telomere-associated protein RIF1 [Dryobates pubescens]|uniref:telomere-associated protein RIF1 n=1 Tax=Dryobates pubescens TaxID=118200 RepID=UPI0023B89670|nr:telomere-associated protein RIF1 [Dryobates pubescens]
MNASAAASSLQPLLETLEDSTAPPEDLTDAHLTIVNRLTGEESKQFTANVRKHFPRLCKVFKAHISNQNSELNNAALQALGFCVFNSSIVSELSATEIRALLSEVTSVAVKASDKNTRTRALWVISKQTFPSEIVQKEVSNIISTLETIFTKGDLQSSVVEYEALNVIIRLVEQTPAQMGEEAVRWAKLIIPLVVHSTHKVQLRGATALEMGMPLLLQKQQEVAAVTEHLMTTKLISELQKLFSTKNETYVLKLWPLFVKLLGKALHRSGSFINSLLQLEELGFRSGSPVVKKIAFIAWKSLIDNFALNPDILCSAKRLKLLMQPLSSIHVRTEALALTKLEVWWYLLMRLGPQLPANFEQVCVPLIQSTLSLDSSAAVLQGTPSRVPANQSLAPATPAQKSGPYSFATPATPRMNLNSSTAGLVAIPSIQLLGIEMLLHFLMGPEVLDFAKQNKVVLSLEPLQNPLISTPSFFCKHASTFINAVQDGFIAIGKEVPDCMLNVIWKDINGYVKTAIESGNKKEKQGSEILTLLLQALKNIVRSNSLPVQKILSLIDITVKELPPKVLGSPAYQIADMDLLNGTPALFLLQLPFHNNLLECCVTEERFFVILETLVGYVLSGPASPLAFSESVICIINQSAKQVENKEHLWRMWSIVVNPLTEWINRTNEVNQGDALEHNFNAVYSALLLPVLHILPVQEFPQPTMKSLLRTWSDLYRAFARCAALVATAEENLCCEELCAKIIAGLEGETPVMLSMMDGLTHILSVMVDCINFAPYATKYQPKTRAPQTSTDWAKKKKEPLGKLASLFKLLVMLLSSFHVLSSKEPCSDTLVSVGPAIFALLHSIISHVSLPSVIGSMFAVLSKPLAVFYEKTMLPDVSKVYSHLNTKLEKLLAEIMLCLQSHCTGSYDAELLEQLCPLLCVTFQHKSKQIRNQAAHFWNATFAKAAALTYPEELKAVLSQAKKKMPLLLPGFENIEMAEDCSSPFSDVVEDSQLDAKISGMEVKLGQKRDSVLGQTSEIGNEVKDKCNNMQATPAKLKLDFSSSKPRSEVLLEEEASADFVFIPPETKTRVLTEHQKEVLRSKRIGIPAMYNNLDSSQDTTLFSQYTQSQEDSLEKSSLMEDAKEVVEDKPQEENGKSEEGCSTKADEISEPAAEDTASCLPTSPVTCLEESSSSKRKEDSKEETDEMVVEQPSAGEGLETSSVEAAPEEPSEGNDNTANVSSSSASSDVVSGTPQPASRRQSFITLEKFGSSESRPFSPSPLNSVSGTSASASGAGKKESTSSKTAAGPEKAGDDDKKPEQVFTAIRKLTRRQSKMEQEGQKQSQLSARLEQESLASSSVENSPGLLSAEDVEQVLLAQSQALRSSDLDIKKAEDVVGEIERERLADMDAKENTPPGTAVSSEQVTAEDSQVPPASPSQKVLRRSLRRRSEAAESAAGSQEAEDGHQKRSRHKDSEKSAQKKVPQAKDDGSQKQKVGSGKSTENTSKPESSLGERAAAEDLSSKEPPASRGLEEVSRSARRPEENLKADTTEGPDSSEGAEGQTQPKRPRYHTRRASQGLLSSIENSEAEGSETKQESAKRRKQAKGKSRDDPPEDKLKEQQPGSCSQELSSQGGETKGLEAENRAELSHEASRDAAPTAEPGELPTQVTPADSSRAVAPASSEASPDLQSPSGEQSRSGALAELHAAPPASGGQGLRAAEETSQPEKQPPTEDSASSGKVPPSQTPEGHLKRSKRLKRLKNCSCCLKKVKEEAVPFTRSPKEVTHEEKEPQTTPVQTPASTPELSGSSQSDESLPVAPCAMSTPLHPPKQLRALNVEGEGSSAENLQGNKVMVEENLDAECLEGEIILSLVEIQGPFGQTDQCLSEPASDEPGDSRLAAGDQSEEPAAAENEDTSQSRQLEETSEVLTVSKPEGKQLKELESHQDGEKAESKAGETGGVQDAETEGLGETEATVSEDVALDKENVAEGRGVGSPQKPADVSSVVSESPNGVQARCVWSPSASPSTGILKRGVKRSQDDDSLSPANKSRRVSFANPIYQEGLADDIDRRSPVVRSHSSPSSRSLKVLSNGQPKRITTPTKGFLPLESRKSKLKSSKKCLIREMAMESPPSRKECMYPALVGCKTPVSVILPQITTSLCARGMVQVIRARNIRTVGDLSNLTAAEIENLPILSPKVYNVRKALRGYHEQQVKSRGLEEIAVLEDVEKPSEDAEKPKDTEPSENVEKTEDFEKPSEDADKPQDFEKPSEDVEKPSEDAEKPQDFEKPSEHAVKSEDMEEPSEDAEKPQDLEKPSEDVEKPQDFEKPSEDVVKSEAMEEPSEDVEMSEHMEHPSEDAEEPEDHEEEKPLVEEQHSTALVEAVAPAPAAPAPADLLSQMEALAAQLSSAELLQCYSGSQLFEMQAKLLAMTNCIMRNLQARWQQPPPEGS